MLTVTDAACAAMAELLAEAELPEDDPAVVRLFYGDEGLGVVFDEATADDNTFTHEGAPVLAVDAKLAEALEDQTLDVEQSEGGMELTLQASDPPAKS
jgi:Fe-S cluster assembly iron-binding protein IscA